MHNVKTSRPEELPDYTFMGYFAFGFAEGSKPVLFKMFHRLRWSADSRACAGRRLEPAVPMVVGPGCGDVGGYACAPWADHALAPDNRLAQAEFGRAGRPGSPALGGEDSLSDRDLLCAAGVAGRALAAVCVPG